jgi:hypothetical protein
MEIVVISAEWILEKIPHTHYADGDGNVSVYTAEATDAHFIELAFETLCISFESYDYMDDNGAFVFGFDFRLEDIEAECPSLHLRMKEMNNNNWIRKNSLKN